MPVYVSKNDAKLENFLVGDLRHTAASRLLRAVPDLATAQEFLGHTDMQTTRRYVHKNKDDIREAMEASQALTDEKRRKLNPEERRKTFVIAA